MPIEHDTIGETPTGRRGMALSFWASESALRESGVGLGDVRSRASVLGISVTELERLDVIFQEDAETP